MKPFRYDFTYKNKVTEREREKFCSFCRKKRKQLLNIEYSKNPRSMNMNWDMCTQKNPHQPIL